MSGTSGLSTNQMSENKPDPKKVTLSESLSQWIQQAIPCLICAIIIGIFVWMAQPNSTFNSSSSAADGYYNLQAQGFSEGHLYLKRDAPAALARLANPYDPIANARYVAALGDISYYKGRLFLYFGVTPALVLFWPYHALTGDYLSDGTAVAILFAIGFAAFLALARAICRRYFSERYIGMVTGFVVILGLMTGLTSFGQVYDVAIFCGFAFAMLALSAIWHAIHAGPKGRVVWLSVASLAYGLAVASRQSLLFGSVVLLIPVIQIWPESPGRSRHWPTFLSFAAAFVPITLVGLGLMVYNDMRFGSPFEFGWRYQLNGIFDQTTAHQFNPGYLWFDFRTYFLHRPELTAHFPFLRSMPITPLPPGYDPGSANAGGGILWRYPLVLLAVAAPLAYAVAPRADMAAPALTVSGLRWFVTALFLLFITGSILLCLFFAVGSGYEMDFLPGLLLLSVIGFLALERVASSRRRRLLFLRWVACLLLAYSLAFNVFSSVEAHAGNNCQAGNSLLHEKRLVEALVQYQDAESLWPDNADAHRGLGSTYELEGRMDEAIAEYRKVLEISPDNPFAHDDLGHCLFETGSTNEAVAEYEKAIQIDPNAGDSRVGLGSCLFNMGRRDDAIVQFQKAVELKPTDADGHGTLGAAFLAKDDFDKAIVEFQKAIEIHPDSARAWFSLGDAFSKKGTFDEAVAAYQKGIELRPDSAQAYNRLGDAFRGDGKATNAIASYRTAMDIDSQSLEAQVNLAWTLATWPDASIRNGGEAVALMTKANELCGNQNDRVLRALAAAYAETGNFAQAASTAKRALDLATRETNTTLTNKLLAEIKRYQAHSPTRSKSD